MRKLLAFLFATLVMAPAIASAGTCFLKQSTALSTGIRLGPFVDQTDGFTAETALTLSQADIRLSKNEGAFAQKNEATSCTHLENGYYKCPLDATDTNTAGILLVAVNESGALPVWKECTVLPGATFDALVTNAAGAANGFLIAGTNAPITFSGSGAAMTLTSTGGNGAGLAITGNGSGNGVTVAAGATGKGVSVTTTAGDGVSVTPTAGHALVLTANGTSKHGMTVTGGTAGTSHGALFTAGTGGKDLQAATGITVDACTGCSTAGGVTIMPETAYVKGSTSIIEYVFIKDTSTNLGKTGLTSASGGLTIAFRRADQGNAAWSTCAPQAATRGSYTSCGFVEDDATNGAGIYQIGLTTPMLATGADKVEVAVLGVAGTSPTILPIALVDTGLAAINTKLGTPAGASVSADIASLNTLDTAIKAKTDSLGFTGSNVNANVQATAASLSYNLTGNISGSVGSVSAVGTGAIIADSFTAGAIDNDAIGVDSGLKSIRSNTAAAGGATSITLDAAANATDDLYNGSWVTITSGTGAGQSRLITDYAGGTQVATVAPAWATNPDNTSTFAITSAAKVAGVEGNVTGNLTGSVASVSGNVGGNVTGSVGSVSGTTFPASFPANITAMQIDANGVVTAGGTFRKNTASQVFPIYLVNAAGVAVTGSTVSVTVSKDGAAFGAITGSVVETGSGWYDVNLSQADTNCTNCKYVATGTGGATARPFFFRTAP